MVTPYEVTLGTDPYYVVDSMTTREDYLKDHPELSPDELGLIALAIFRNNSYVDYAAVGRVDDVGEEIAWSRCYEAYEWIDWMAGFAYRDPERSKQLKDLERKLGSFFVKHGFAPDVVLESRPSDIEMEGFIQHVLEKDEVNGQLTMPEEPDEE